MGRKGATWRDFHPLQHARPGPASRAAAGEKAPTNFPAEDLAELPDLVGRDFTAEAPGRKWCEDATVSARGQVHILQPFWTAAP